MEWIRFGLSTLCMLAGLFVVCCGVFGVYRFKFILNRMHSAAILDTMGLFFIILSIVISRGFDAVTVKYFLLLVFLWLTSPISSHLIAKMEFFTDKDLEKEVTEEIDMLSGGDDSDSSNL